MWLKNLDKIIIFGGFIIMVSMIYMSGMEKGRNEVTAEFNEQAMDQARKNAVVLAKKQREITQIEAAWLAEKEQVKIVYRDKIRTVTKTVKEYVEANNLTECKLDATGVQRVNEALSRAKKPGHQSKPYDSLRATANAD